MLIGYAKVSSIEQHLDVQLAKLRQAGCERIYAEKRSGTDEKRPELKACLDYLREGETLVVTRLDRLARSLAHLCMLAAELKQCGLHLLVLDQSLDTSTPSGTLLFHLLGAIAEFENRLRHERQMEGIAHAKAQGRHFGRSKRLTPAQVEELCQLKASGLPVPQLVQRYGLTRASVYRYLAQAQPAAQVEAAD